MNTKPECNYQELIDNLIQCDSDQVESLLQTCSKLQNATLLYQLLQRGTEFQREGKSELASRFHQVAFLVIQSIIALPQEGTVSMYLHTKQDADCLFQQGVELYQLSQFRSALQTWQQALSIYQELGDDQGEAYVLDHLSVALQSLGQYQKAIERYQESLVIKRESGDWMAQKPRFMPLTHHAQGEFHLAMKLTIEHFEKHLKIACSIGDRLGESNSLANLGRAYDSLGKAERALSYYLESEEIKKQIGDRQGRVKLLQALGKIYQKLGKTSQAIYYYQQHITLASELEDTDSLDQSLSSLGNLFCASKEYTNALKIYQQYLQWSQDHQDFLGMSVAWNGLGNVFYAGEDYSKALNAYEKSLDFKHQTGDRFGEAIVLANLSRTHEALGHYERAKVYLRQSIQIKQQRS
ncbi:tetratricopeptide repeat protein [Spirulina subsalsa FACHB-351]|uniref:Tetratricopeptide repeat protein n=1 Tax=Spirulina subsalsa FACHB-351 TaxID=234711 RepID=A0ABT3L899_9CYAN|nr:tetratricopeptide repeat protein [Spirulina subsalsa]MCW6037741.1 tetratricopeptide repeat protein [Spirulina subsalsa FACHB-351]